MSDKRIDEIKIQGIYDFGYGIVAKLVMCDNSISIGAKALYSYICSFAGAEKKAWPGRAKICSDLKISKDSFSKYLNELKTHNYIAVQHRKNEKGQFHGNIYIIVTQLEDSQYKNPCPKISDTEKPYPKKPCPKKPDTVQSLEKSQSEPCPKKPDPVKPCPEISDTKINRSFKINSTKKQQRDLDQVTKRELDPDSFLHNPVVVSSKSKSEEMNKSCEKVKSRKNDYSFVAVGDDVKKVIQALVKCGVDKNKAEELTDSFSADRIQQVINYTSVKKPANASGYIIRALENDWSIPEAEEEEKPDLLKEQTRKFLEDLEQARCNADPPDIQFKHLGAVLSQLRCSGIHSTTTCRL